MSRIAILSATENNNLKLSHTLKEHIEDLDMKAQLIRLEELNLPLYTPTEEKKGIPEMALWLTKKLNQCNGLILVAPEYNGSIPPIMNNAIAWVSRSGSEDWRASFNEKIAVVATHSGGGGQKVTSAMKQQLEHLGCFVLPRAIVTNYQKTLNPDSVKTIFSQMKKLLKA